MKTKQLSGLSRSLSSRQVCVRAYGRESVLRTIQQDIRSKKRSAEEVTRHYLENIRRAEPVVKSYITVDGDNALQQVGHMEHNGQQHVSR